MMVFRFPTHTSSSSTSSSGRGSSTTSRGGQKVDFGPSTSGRAHNEFWSANQPRRVASYASATAEPGYAFHLREDKSPNGIPSEATEGHLPEELLRLLDLSVSVQLPGIPEDPAMSKTSSQLQNWQLDKLLCQLGGNKATWKRGMMLFEWLKASGHPMDDRLCTTIIRLSADNGDAVGAMAVYEWLRAPRSLGGAGLKPSTFTYTTVMRAATGAKLPEKALQVWSDAKKSGLVPDSRMCTAYIEACTKLGHTEWALATYSRMKAAPPKSFMSPSIYSYVATIKAACEGGRWMKALDVWSDMKAAGCPPSGHAYAAVISACAAGGDWMRAVSLFEEMTASGVNPDVVSCTALVNALASCGEADKAEAVVKWMLANGLSPNVRTYTALLTSLGNAKQYDRAVEMLYKMQLPEWGGIQPNAYTYSVVLKALGDQGQWRLAESIFSHLEHQVLAAKADAVIVKRVSANRPPQPQSAMAQTVASSFNSKGRAVEPDQHKVLQSHPLVPDVSSAAPPTSSRRESCLSDAWSSPSQLNGLHLDLGGMPRGNDTPGTDRRSGGLNQRPQMRSNPASAPSLSQAPSLPCDAKVHGSQHHLDIAISPSEALVALGGKTQSLPHDSLINEVVCGALMLSYERAGMWTEAVSVIGRAQALGLRPNTVMFNTAISAAGKAGKLDLVARLYSFVPEPCAITHETMIASYGMCGEPEKAESILEKMIGLGHKPRCYAWCGLIAGYSLTGSFDLALAVRKRIKRDKGVLSVHVYNALLASCERNGRSDEALKLLGAMKRERVQPNSLTHTLMASVGRKGVQRVEEQQAALTAISAAVAAAGGILMHKGVF